MHNIELIIIIEVLCTRNLAGLYFELAMLIPRTQNRRDFQTIILRIIILLILYINTFTTITLHVGVCQFYEGVSNVL